MSKNKSLTLKEEILKQYRSIKQFADEMNIPYSTLNSALDGKIEGMAYGTVMKICEKLSLNPIDFTPLTKNTKTNQILAETKLSYYYSTLNTLGKEKIMEIADDLSSLDKYTQ